MGDAWRSRKPSGDRSTPKRSDKKNLSNADVASSKGETMGWNEIMNIANEE